MKLQIGPGAVDLTLVDEHGSTVCTFAVCDEDARQLARKMTAAFNHHDELVAAVDKATKSLVAERDCFFDSVTDAEGNVADKGDAESLADFDAEIDDLRATLAKVQP